VTPPAGGGDAHLSIGEVLAELRDEFPDITISKIRFLESQGLVNPERTPSGYRKFYEADLVRLRWILHQQKEHFLPLKVIKERLDSLPPGAEATLLDPAPAAAPPAATAAAVPAEATPAAPAPPSARARRAPVRPRPPAFAPDLPAEPDTDDGAVVARVGGGVSRQELARAAGLEPDQLAALESFGLVTPSREAGGDAEFDDDAVEVARIAAGFFSRGVEARHLRMYRNFAEREAVLFGQVLMPFVRQRNPEARVRMQEELVELATLGRRLRLVLLREAVRDALAE
jgi:DNA-binding transcriptional MerR regulator